MRHGKAGGKNASKQRIARPAGRRSKRATKRETTSVKPLVGLAKPAPSANDLFPIVGIGASAGGLETFTQLLSQLPADTGMGFVYVQHLDPHHESLLTALLSKTTAMPVHEARDGMAVEPNHVYIIPPNANLGLLQGKLTLMPRSEFGEPHMSIDYFLRSLADDRRNRAIGVILSGTASDGSLGLQAIKAAGGLTFAQQPESAKYDGMPRSAIAAGVVDFVLPPQEIAKELARIGQHPYLSFSPFVHEDVLLHDADNELAKIFLMLRMSTGVDFTYYKPTTIKRRVMRRMLLNKIERISNYVRYLKDTPLEIDALYHDLLINVTSFFRDPEAFETLKAKVFPKLIKEQTRDAPLRLWVPGCASGEEVYSLAIALLEHMGEGANNFSIQIFATDINDAALEKARAGIYTENALSGVSRERLRRFFVKVEGGYQVKKTVRDICLFARQDLSRDPPFSKLDLISCRNVLIYLSLALQKKIIPTFHYALKPYGALMLGNSETIGTFADLFSLLGKKNKIYTKKTASHRPPPNFATTQPPVSQDAVVQRNSRPERGEPDIQKEADRIVLAKYAPASVLVNESLDILQFRGRTGNYLEPVSGTASLNLLKMTREGLMLELRSAIHLAKKRNAPIQRHSVEVKSDGQSQEVTLEVIPLKPPGAKERYFLVTFESAGRRTDTPRPPAAKAGRTRRSAEARRSMQLQQQLAATREYLQSTTETHEATNEELRSALEEIQSSNEELQSVNEELETAKEELQSTNEELSTVNDELQNRNAELNQVNNDVVNLLSSVNIPVVMLGEDLRIRRFSATAEKVLNLIPSDVGRPLADLRMHFILPDLPAIIHEVMETLVAQEIELRDDDRRWYSVRIRPYKTTDNKIDGVVLALVDIDSVKRGMLEAQEARDYAQAIVETVREPLLILDTDLRVHTANRSYYRFFQTTPPKTENRFLYDLDDGHWNIPRLRELLGQLLPHNTRIDDFEVDGEFARVGRRRLLLNATRIEREVTKTPLILLAMEDVTTRSPDS